MINYYSIFLIKLINLSLRANIQNEVRCEPKLELKELLNLLFIDI